MADILGNITAEYPGSGNKDIGTSFHNSLYGTLIDSTVNLNIHIQILFVDQFSQFLNLLCTLVHIFLSAKARLNSHHQNHIHILKHVTDIIYRSCRLDGNTNFHSCILDTFYSTFQILTCLSMNGDGIRTTIYKILNVSFRLCHHKMNIKKHLGFFANGFDHRHTKRNAWYKISIHNINMEPFNSFVFKNFNLFAQTVKIR